MGKPLGLEARGETESEIEAADQKGGRQTASGGPFGDLEVAVEKEAVRPEGGAQLGQQVVDLGLGEAIEDEVNGNEIVLRFRIAVDERIGRNGAEAPRFAWQSGLDTPLGQANHGLAAVEAIDAYLWLVAQQGQRKSSIAVANDQRVAETSRQRRQISNASLLQTLAEYCPFQWLVGLGQKVKGAFHGRG